MTAVFYPKKDIMGNNFNYNKHPKKKKSFLDESYVPPYDKELLQQSIDILKLSDVVKEKLLSGNVKTVFDVVRRCEKDFYRIPTFDKRNLGELKSALNNKRLRLKPMAEPAPKQEEKPEAKKNEVQVKQGSNPKDKKEGLPAREKGKEKNVQPSAQKESKGRDKVNDKNHKPQNGRINEQKLLPKQGKVDKKVREEISEARTKEEREKLRPKKVPVVYPQDKYIKINKNGKWGFATRDGKEVIKPEYDEVFLFHEELCCVELGDKFGFIDRKGEVVIPIVYDCALSFSEGYACVFKGEHCGYIDRENNVVVDFEFDAATPVIDGNSRVKRIGKWGELHIDNPAEIRWII